MSDLTFKKDNRSILEVISDNILSEILFDEVFRDGQTDILDAIKNDIEKLAYPKMAIYDGVQTFKPKLTEEEEEIYLDVEIERIDNMAKEIYDTISKSFTTKKELLH